MILDVRNLEVGYAGKPVLSGINFQVAEGEILAILGPNGSGKTTLLKSICGILKASAGSVTVAGSDIRRTHPSESARLIGYVAQRNDGARITAFDAILLGRKPRMGWRVTEADLRSVDAVIKRLNLQHLALHYIDQMSGGELQKVCLARALVQEPTVLLLDEPTSSLDLKNQHDIMCTIRRIIELHPVGVVMTMHDLNLAVRYADRFLLLKQGRVYSEGQVGELQPETIEEVYGVQVEVIQHRGRTIVVPSAKQQHKE